MSKGLGRAIAASCVVAGVVFATLGWLRYATFHNETFDLAFYARMAWGTARANLWEPIIGAPVLGLHISPILVPLGLLGMIFGTVPVLIAAQAGAMAATAWPFARMGARRLGPAGAVAGAAGWLLYPCTAHVATFEFHPGNLAVLPLAYALDALDREDARGMALGVLGVLLCREDLGLATGMLGVLAWLTVPSLRRTGRNVTLASFGWVLVFALVLHPLFAPAHGSMQAHFGRWGNTATQVVVAWITHPGAVLAHLAVPFRLTYLPKLLLPLGLLSLLRPRWLLVAAPILAINLMSDFPGTTDLDSHYLLPAVPVLLAAAIDGASLLAQRIPATAAAGWLAVPVTIAHLIAGGTPIAADFDAAAFTEDAHARAARRIVDAIPPDASVQAPFALLPHLAERTWVWLPPPPEKQADYVVLDAWHRRRWRGRETLLRTKEEPRIRDWLGRDDHGLVMAAGDLLLLRRGGNPYGGVGARYVVGRAPANAGTRLAACLGLLGVHRAGADRIALDLVARGPCPRDLAVRIGTRPTPTRVGVCSSTGCCRPSTCGRANGSARCIRCRAWLTLPRSTSGSCARVAAARITPIPSRSACPSAEVPSRPTLCPMPLSLAGHRLRWSAARRGRGGDRGRSPSPRGKRRSGVQVEGSAYRTPSLLRSPSASSRRGSRR